MDTRTNKYVDEMIHKWLGELMKMDESLDSFHSLDFKSSSHVWFMSLFKLKTKVLSFFSFTLLSFDPLFLLYFFLSAFEVLCLRVIPNMSVIQSLSVL